MPEIKGANQNGSFKTLLITPNCKYTSWDYWFVAQELKLKVSERSEFNWQRYGELIKMAPLRHEVVTPNSKWKSWDYWLVEQELRIKVS